MIADTPSFPMSNTARATGMSFRAPVPLAALLRPVGEKVWVSTSSFLALLRRVLNAILSRVARTFNVNLDMPPPANGEGPQASFVSSADNPGGQQAVEAAAGAATREVNEFVQGLVGKQPALERFGGETGPAYLAMVLEELGASLATTQAEIQALEATVAKHLPAAAALLGVSPAAARALFEEGEVPETGEYAKAPAVKALLETFSRLVDANREVARMRASFGDHCVAARGAGPGLEEIVQAKVAKFSGQNLEILAENSLSQVRTDEKQAAGLISSVNLRQTGKVVPIRLASVIEPTVQVEMPGTGFRSRAGRFGGGIDDGVVPPATNDFDDIELPNPSRER